MLFQIVTLTTFLGGSRPHGEQNGVLMHPPITKNALLKLFYEMSIHLTKNDFLS